MKPDDQIRFIWLRDNSRTTYDRIKGLLEKKREIDAGTETDPMLIHDQSTLQPNIKRLRDNGKGLEELLNRYPDNTEVANAYANWQVYVSELGI